LIEKMQVLGSDESAPAQKSKMIRALQDEWKLLGHSDDNDALWIQFTEVARVAFEPCKIYFKERKEKQAGNLIARNNICEQLEAYAATMQEGSINLSEVSRLENQAREDWKKYAPVAQNKIKNLQKRFNEVLAELRQKKRTALQIHNDQKQALIEQAKTLLELEDLQAAIQQAKQLQQDWKALGPGSFKEDRKLWAEFRAACDALFARRDEISKESKQQLRQASTEVREVLRRINALLSLDDEAFSDSRGQFNALGQEFHKALTPDLKAERKALQDQFQKLSKRFDARLRATPDKKVLQLLQQVQMKAAFCQRHEEALLTGGATVTRESVEEEWKNLASISDEVAEQAMKKRFRQLLQLLDGTTDCQALADKQELRGRELCVDAEIMAGVETPAADKAIRMQQQLNHLQRGLGRLPVTQKERLQKMLDTDIQFLCLGPLKPLVRSTLANRLQQIRQKL
jgi:DNA repair protein SbcC/Rad50